MPKVGGHSAASKTPMRPLVPAPMKMMLPPRMITTLIGVAGVALGVAALLTTLSVMNGFQQDIQQKIIGAQSHIIVFGQMSRSTYNDFREKIERMPSVAAVAPMAMS